MTRRISVCLGAICAVVLSVSAAHATASCEVTGAGSAGVALRVEAAPAARTIRRLKNGDLVSLFDDEAARKHKGWSRVAHSMTEGAPWGSGERGWVETRFLKDCG